MGISGGNGLIPYSAASIRSLNEITMSSKLFTSLTPEQREILKEHAEKHQISSPIEDWDDDKIRERLSRELRIPWIEVNQRHVDRALFLKMKNQCRQYNFLPAYQGGVGLHVFMPDGFQGASIRAIRNLFHREIHPIGTSLRSLERVMSFLEQWADGLPPSEGQTHKKKARELLSWNFNGEDPRQFVERVLIESYMMNASDVFFEQYPDRLEIRFKISGEVVVMPPVLPEYSMEVISQTKAFGGLSKRESHGYRSSSAELVMPDGNKVGFRVEAQKSLDGETITLRLLDKQFLMRLVGIPPFPEPFWKQFQTLLNQKDGLILVCGPTGSGKTTTLWRCLLSLNASEKKIVTIEDPVEYRIDRFVQLPVTGKTMSTDEHLESFSKAVRSCMRAAPDVILIGEIRDEETASAALEASLTGHLILSTIHTPDSIGAIPRLLDKNQSALNISQTMTAVVSQRLVPRLCERCKIPSVPTDDQCKHFRFHGLEVPSEIYSRNGCPHCNEGWSGRVPVFEFLFLDPELRTMINDHFDAMAFREVWMKKGGETLGKNALRKVAEGLCAYESAAPLDPYTAFAIH